MSSRVAEHVVPKGVVRTGVDLATTINPAVVAIGIRRGGHARSIRLVIESPALQDPVVYWTPPHATPTPGRARSVEFAADQLQAGETLRIVPKPGQPRHFDMDEAAIAFPAQIVSTGRVVVGPGPDRVRPWSYSVRLEHAGHLVAELDPVIIISEDP